MPILLPRNKGSFCREVILRVCSPAALMVALVAAFSVPSARAGWLDDNVTHPIGHVLGEGLKVLTPPSGKPPAAPPPSPATSDPSAAGSCVLSHSCMTSGAK
jgi:hypothetical protein